MVFTARIKRYNKSLKQGNTLRIRCIRSTADNNTLFFDSNDYLSLSHDRYCIQAYQHGFKKYPASSGSSMLLGGYHRLHQQVEEAFAHALDVDACVLFSSGYAANLAVMALIQKINAHCILDKAVHASVYDGLHLAKAKYTRYCHNNMLDLQKKLNQQQTAIIVTEGIFSMSGQITPLDIIASLSRNDCYELIVDEAHSFGILGPQGRGACSAYNLSQREVPLQIIPLGKACAAQGAIVAGRADWIEALLQVGRSIIYSTASSPALCYGLLHSLDALLAADKRRAKLMQLIHFFQELTHQSPLHWVCSFSPIQSLHLGCPKKAMYYAQQLAAVGIYCSAIRVPTVVKKHSGLRISLNYTHQHQDIVRLFNQLHIIYEHSLS